MIWTGSLNDSYRLGGRVGLYDTTLRDGEQTVGVVLDPEQKLEIARLLDSLGVDRIEAGFPRVSADDWEEEEGHPGYAHRELHVGKRLGGGCPHCGRALQPGWNFCPYCTKSTVVEPKRLPKRLRDRESPTEGRRELPPAANVAEFKK